MFSDRLIYLQETTDTKKVLKAQALVLTLLVLAILSIVIIGIVIISNRDVSQVVSNEKYERLYNESEKILQQTVQETGLSEVPSESCELLSVSASRTEYDCGQITTISNNIEVYSELIMVDNRRFEDYPVSKDQSMSIKLYEYDDSSDTYTYYSSGIEVRWSRPVALEFSLVYVDSSGNYRRINDVYDMANVFDSLSGDDPYNDINNIHPFQFNVLDSNNLATTVQFNLSSIEGLNGNPRYLKITPRTRTAGDIININVQAGSENNFPIQVREFYVRSTDPLDTESPLVNLFTQIPVAGQTDYIFDYSLLIRENLIH